MTITETENPQVELDAKTKSDATKNPLAKKLFTELQSSMKDARSRNLRDTDALAVNVAYCFVVLTERLKEAGAKIRSLEAQIILTQQAHNELVASLNEDRRTLEARIKVLEAQSQTHLKYCGVFKDGVAYTESSIVTHHSQLWLAILPSTVPPHMHTSPKSWRLISKGLER